MRQWIESASRDMAEQLQAVRAISATVQQVNSKEPGEEEWLEVQSGQRNLDFENEDCVKTADNLSEHPSESVCPVGPTGQFFDMVEFEGRVRWAKGLAGDSGDVMRDALKRAGRLGQTRRLAQSPEIAILAAIGDDFPNFKKVTEFVERRGLLCSVTPNAAFKLPPILLSGPPGTGKTAFSQRLARALNVPLTCIDVSTLDTAFKLTGLDAGYSSGHPGLIWDALQQECMSPVILLDELEKQPLDTRHTGLGFLLGLLEPISARQYQDAALRLPIDASHVTWIATCNNVDEIDAPLRSRFRTFHIGPPNKEETHAVVRSVHKALRNAEDWALAFEPDLSTAVVSLLLGRTPREIRQALEDAYAQAAAAGRRALLPEDLPAVRYDESQKNVMGFIG